VSACIDADAYLVLQIGDPMGIESQPVLNNNSEV
jgi:hypothetical protein